MHRLLPLLLSLFLLAACGGDSPTEPPPPTLSGTWTGSMRSVPVTMTLSEREESISGSGNLAAGADRWAFTVQGTHVFPTVSLILQVVGFETMNFRGTVSNANTVRGEVNGSGFASEPFTLQRQ